MKGTSRGGETNHLWPGPRQQSVKIEGLSLPHLPLSGEPSFILDGVGRACLRILYLTIERPYGTFPDAGKQEIPHHMNSESLSL